MLVDTSRPENQIVPFAKFLVRCACGYAHDSHAPTAEQAITEIAAQHEPTHASYTATAYAQPPLTIALDARVSTVEQRVTDVEATTAKAMDALAAALPKPIPPPATEPPPVVAP